MFEDGNTSIWLEKVSVIKKAKNTVPQAYVVEDLNVEEIIATFYKKKNCERQINLEIQN